MKEKNKYSFLKANIVFLWEIMPSVWSVFSQNNMALTIFAICITGSVIGIIVCTSRYVMQKRKYSRSLTKRKRRLIQEAESDETKKIDLAIEIERETDKYQKTCKWLNYNYAFLMVSLIGFIACLYVCNPKTAVTFNDYMVKAYGLERDVQEEYSNQLNNTEGEGADNMTADEEYILDAEESHSFRIKSWKFVLDNPDYQPHLEMNQEEQVFFYLGQSELDSFISEEIEAWTNEKKTGVDCKKLIDQAGNSYYTYTEAEDIFSQKIEDAEKYDYWDSWMKNAPHSADLNAYMLGRERLNCIQVDGKVGCFELWWRLANDNLLYAQEYERQTQNSSAALYYYVKSIYCCQEALKYEMDEKMYERIFHFMTMRYHDMSSDQSCIEIQYKQRASEIYDVIRDMDALSN